VTRLKHGLPKSNQRTGNEAFVLEALSAMTRTLATKARLVLSHSGISVAFEGIVAVAVGVGVIVWPSASLAVMVLVFAAYAAADGMLSVLAAVAERDAASLAHGLAGLTLAAAVIAWRDVSATILVYVIAVWVVVMALLRIRSAVSSHKAHLLKAVLVLLAVPSVAGAVTAVLSPGDGASSVLIDIAVFQIINGLTIIGFALRTSQSPTVKPTSAKLADTSAPLSTATPAPNAG
jgi:uncharacterized membrane protein HdeD (DUF308 family)